MTNRLFAGALCSLFSGLLWANSAGPPAGVAGAPNEPDCSSCHGGAAGTGKLTITFADGSTAYTPGQKIRMKVTLEDPSASRWGFQITARKTASPPEGVGKLESANNLTQVESVGGADFVSHTGAGTFRATRNSASWEFDWTAPAAGSGGVTFYAAGNAANNNGSETGDRIYKAAFAVTEAGGGSSPTVVTHTGAAFAHGGGWATTVYFVNGNSAEAGFDVKFAGNDGKDMEVPGGANRRVTIPARGLGSIVLPNEGGLSQGSILTNLPDGVTGFALLRLATPNQPDQEIMAPISKTNEQTRTVLVFDDTSISTNIAVMNAGGAEATAALTVRDEAGATIGTSEIRLAAGARTVVKLGDRVAAAGGKRGTVEVSMAGSQVNALAMRAGGSALVATEAILELPQ